MTDRERRLWGALAAITFGGLILTTIGFWPASAVTGTADLDGVRARPSFDAGVGDARNPSDPPVLTPATTFAAATSAGTGAGTGGGPNGGTGGAVGGGTPKRTPTPTAAPTPTPPPVASCTLFPSSNVWNKRVDSLPVASNSSMTIAGIGLTAALHPDFSSLAWNGGLGYGIPFNKVTPSTPTYTVAFDYADESDPGPYPIPSSPKIEGDSDRHLLAWDTTSCQLFELYDAVRTSNGWTAGSGAVWDLTSNALRPAGWTSADAAGLPILPGLARYDEVAAGAILHALRFTAPRTCASHIFPARHDAGSYSCASYPPMGLRVRLKASVDVRAFPPQARVILTALKRYGMLLADNGSAWYVTGAPNAGWNDDDLHTLGQLHGSDFEVVDTSSLRNG